MTLKVEIYGRNLDIKDDIQTYVEKKVSKLDRFLQGVDEARVDLAHEKNARQASDRFIAQITIQGKKVILRSEERAENILTAIDAAIEKIQRRMERYKGKRLQRADRRSASELAGASSEAAVEEEYTPIIARRKKFILIPMDEMEAIEQMNLLGHNDFFVFYNAQTNNINVLYQRRDGTYGIIEPELG